MKILHIVNNIYQGGIRSLVLDLIKYQIRQGHEVAILSLLADDKYYQTVKEFEDAGVKIIRGKYAHHYNPLNVLLIRGLIKEYDIVHTHHSPTQLYTRFAYSLIPKRKHPAIITTEHNTTNGRRNYPILKVLERFVYQGYDKIVCISPATETNLKEWLNSKNIDKKIVTICNGIDIEKYAKAENNISSIVKADEANPQYVVMVGRMAYPKDPFTLLESLPYCPPNTHLIFVGTGKYYEEVKQRAEQMNVQDRVHLLGIRGDVPEILKGCKVGVLSTMFDGFGLVAAEYMAAGLPVVVTDVEGLRDVVDDRDALFPYKDSQELGQKITHLLTDREYYNKKRGHSLLRAKNFSSEVMNEKYMEVYNELTAQKGGRSGKLD